MYYLFLLARLPTEITESVPLRVLLLIVTCSPAYARLDPNSTCWTRDDTTRPGLYNRLVIFAVDVRARNIK